LLAGIVGGIIILVIIVIASLVIYSIVDPVGFENLMNVPPPPPDVRFYEPPKISKQEIEVGTSEIITVRARNYEPEAVENVSVVISVIEGSNAEAHLSFTKKTSLGNIDTSKGISRSELIQVTAIDISGTQTQFTLELELFVEGISTENKNTIHIKIVPKK